MEQQEYYLLFRGSSASASMMQPGTTRCSSKAATIAGRHHGEGLPTQCHPDEGAYVYGSLLGRRHVDRGLGFDEECEAEDGSGDPPAECGGDGQKRSSETYPDPGARLHRKGQSKTEKPCFMVGLWRTAKLLE
ncbi:hypothetical protein ACVJBD_000095 [Rhizobium mongolense]